MPAISPGEMPLSLHIQDKHANSADGATRPLFVAPASHNLRQSVGYSTTRSAAGSLGPSTAHTLSTEFGIDQTRQITQDILDLADPNDRRNDVPSRSMHQPLTLRTFSVRLALFLRGK